MRRVTGVLVEQLRWWRSGKGELAPAMVTATLGAEAAAAAGEEGRPRKWNGERGAVRAGAGSEVVCVGPPCPC